MRGMQKHTLKDYMALAGLIFLIIPVIIGLIIGLDEMNNSS